MVEESSCYLSCELISIGSLYELLKANDLDPNIEDETIAFYPIMEDGKAVDCNIKLIPDSDSPIALSMRTYFSISAKRFPSADDITDFCRVYTDESVFSKYIISFRNDDDDTKNFIFEQRSTYLMKFGFDWRNLIEFIDINLGELNRFIKSVNAFKL